MGIFQQSSNRNALQRYSATVRKHVKKKSKLNFIFILYKYKYIITLRNRLLGTVAL